MRPATASPTASEERPSSGPPREAPADRPIPARPRQRKGRPAVVATSTRPTKLGRGLLAPGDRPLDEPDDLVGGRAGREDLGDTELLQLRDVVGRDRAADRDDDVHGALGREQ